MQEEVGYCLRDPSGGGSQPNIVYSIQGNVADRNARQNGNGISKNISFTINAVDRHGVVYPEVARTLTAEHDSSPSMTGDHQSRVTDYTAIAVYDTTQITSPLNYSNPKPGDACHPLASQQHPPLAVCAGNGQLNQISMAEQSNTLDCMHDQQIVLKESDKPPRRYIVRRLTPLECCRLQGFPDWWTDGAEGSDSAKYKMWGNGIALPCALHVMQGVARALCE